jgi:hypothetical protein
VIPGEHPIDKYLPGAGTVDPSWVAVCYCRNCGHVWRESSHTVVQFAGMPAWVPYDCGLCIAMGRSLIDSDTEHYLEPAP